MGCGADPTLRSRDGSTAADWARRFGFEDIAFTLDQAREELERLAGLDAGAMSVSEYQLNADPDEVDLGLAKELIHWILRVRAPEMRRRQKGGSESEGPSGGGGSAGEPPLGAVLVFLPGWNEISQLRDELASDARFARDVLVLPLHSMVPPSEQKRVFQRPPRGVSKVVLATNIAETAVTIDDVVFVVDSGRLKEKSYDAHTGVSTLQASWVSRASARQRRGRAGRTRPGECYRLYSSARFEAFAEFQLPEMQRSPLEELCLQVRMLAEASSLGGDRGGSLAAVGTGEGSTAAFLLQAVEPPIPQAIANAVGLLRDVGALRDDESLTRLGRHLGEMPVHPRVGKMLLYATLLGVLDPVLTVACATAYRSPFVMAVDGSREAGKFARRAFSDEAGGGSDHLAVARAFRAWEIARLRGGNGAEREFNRRHSTSGATMNMLKGMRAQLVVALGSRGLARDLPSASGNADAGALVRAVLAVGMYPLVGRVLVPGAGQQAGGGNKATLATLRGEKVKIHPHSVNCNLHKELTKGGGGVRGAFGEEASDSKPPPTLVCFDDITRGEAQMYVRECTVVAPPALVLVAGTLAVEALPPVALPEHDASDPGEAAAAESARARAQAAQDAANEAALVCDDWLKFRVPLAVLSQLACLRIRLARAFAAKVERPNEDLGPDLAGALEAAATMLAHDGGGAAADDRASRALTAAGGGVVRRRRRGGGGVVPGASGGATSGARGTGSVRGGAGRCSRRRRTVSGAARRKGARGGGGGRGRGGAPGAGAGAGGRGRGRGGRGPPPPRVLSGGGGGRGRR